MTQRATVHGESGRRLTAAQAILLAAEDLLAQGKREFSEWDLSIAAWQRDPNRFGMRGYIEAYPDHKRVMMEIMGKRAHNPVRLHWMEKTRPNHYRLTPDGRVAVARLRDIDGEGTQIPTDAAGKPNMPRRLEDLYNAVAVYATHKIYQIWKLRPETPENWTEARMFLEAGGPLDGPATERLAMIESLSRRATDWCLERSLTGLPPGSPEDGPTLSLEDLGMLRDFGKALTYRFPNELPG